MTPHLDIKITAQKKNPFTTAAHNQLVLDLYKQGAFEAGRAEGAKACVRALALEGLSLIHIYVLVENTAAGTLRGGESAVLQVKGYMDALWSARETAVPPAADPASCLLYTS